MSGRVSGCVHRETMIIICCLSTPGMYRGEVLERFTSSSLHLASMLVTPIR